MIDTVVFDMDGTLLDSVDFNAASWEQAFTHFGHNVTFEQARSQIGKGGDNLLPEFLSKSDIPARGKDIEAWRSELFKTKYLPLLRPFSGVRLLMERLRDARFKIAVASSAKESELETYLKIVEIDDLVDVTTCSDDAERSKPHPGIFQAALTKIGSAAENAIAVGDSPYDAEAATRAGMRCIGMLCGGFTEISLRDAGATAVYPGPAALWACFDKSILNQSR